jgi:hypothetical protein
VIDHLIIADLETAGTRAKTITMTCWSRTNVGQEQEDPGRGFGEEHRKGLRCKDTRVVCNVLLASVDRLTRFFFLVNESTICVRICCTHQGQYWSRDDEKIGIVRRVCVLLLLLCRLEDLERAQQALVDAHHGASIVKLAAVVGSTEKGDELAFREELVTIFDDLMSAADEIHVMLL